MEATGRADGRRRDFHEIRGRRSSPNEGIGVDYAVNVVGRYEQEGAVDILAAVRSTGAAVALCSLTTIIGYSSLLMAENRALFLFGLLAVLGEVACLSVALLGLPSFVVLTTLRRERAFELPRLGATPTPIGSHGHTRLASQDRSPRVP